MRLFGFLVLALVSLGGLALADDHVSAENEFVIEQPNAIRFYATWCPKCKVVDKRLEKIRPEFEDSINFVVFEMTDSETRAAAAEQAAKLGLAEVFTRFAPRTGILVLTDSGGDVKDVITYERSSADIRQALKDLTSNQ